MAFVVTLLCLVFVGCRAEEKTAVPSAKQQVDKAQAAADAASQAARRTDQLSATAEDDEEGDDEGGGRERSP